ncbi:MAG: DUF2478 domain-containing protein, partial [Gemmobacter sp.]
KQEAEGRGFRPVVAQAIALGIPVLTSVSQKNIASFDVFADGIATALAPEEEVVVQWCRGRILDGSMPGIMDLGPELRG